MPILDWKPNFQETVRPWVMRRYGPDPMMHAPTDRHDIVVASYNVHKCVGLDGIFDPERTKAVIAELDADIVALQEVDQRFGDREGLLDLDALRRDCGLVPIDLRPTRKGHGWHGNLVLGREGFAHSARQLKLPGVEPRGALIVDFAMPVGPLRIVAAHLGLLRSSRTLQVDAILGALRGDFAGPTLLMGDLNEWRLGARSSLRALDRTFGSVPYLAPSFPANFPVLALDRIVGQRGVVLRTEAHDTSLARTASDHLPVKAWVRIDDRATAKDDKDTIAA